MSLYEPTYMEGTLGTMAVDWEERINMARMRDERKERAQHHIVEAAHDYDAHRDPVGIDSTQPQLAAKLRERGLDIR